MDAGMDAGAVPGVDAGKEAALPRPALPPPLAAYAAPARGTAELWRTLTGLALTLVAGLALYQALGLFAVTLLNPETSQALMDDMTLRSDSPRGALIGLAGSGVFAAGLALALRALHGREIGSLFGPEPHRALAEGLRVAAAAGGLLAVLTLVLPQPVATVANPALPQGLWLALLPLSVAAVLVQAATLELLFRGYLVQQLAARFPAQPVWLALPAALFALLQWSPEAGGAALGWAVWAFAFALAAADLTARTGRLGAAIGFHAAVALAGALLVALPAPGGALALRHLPLAADDPRLVMQFWPDLLALLCAWLAARLALRV
jgi:membrane protease YdiL (CAAX protease family)